MCYQSSQNFDFCLNVTPRLSILKHIYIPKGEKSVGSCPDHSLVLLFICNYIQADSSPFAIFWVGGGCPLPPPPHSGQVFTHLKKCSFSFPSLFPFFFFFFFFFFPPSPFFSLFFSGRGGGPRPVRPPPKIRHWSKPF